MTVDGGRALGVIVESVSSLSKEAVEEAAASVSEKLVEADFRGEEVIEADGVRIREAGLDGQLETIETDSLEGLVERNEVREAQLAQNREDGIRREVDAGRDLDEAFASERPAEADLGGEGVIEADNVRIREAGLEGQAETIETESLRGLVDRNEAREAREAQLAQNREDGMRREADARRDLEQAFLPEAGYEIHCECYLRDADGEIVKDAETGEARRVDFVVIKDGLVEKSIEVTGDGVDKTGQLAKEDRIREQGGNFVKIDGQLVPFGPDVRTEVWRR